MGETNSYALHVVKFKLRAAVFMLCVIIMESLSAGSRSDLSHIPFSRKVIKAYEFAAYNQNTAGNRKS